MDAYSGYNQICINPDDEEKTSFITDRGLYCYSAMSFGLKMWEPRINSWSTVFVDGSSSRAGGRVGVHIITDEGEEHNYPIKLAFKTKTNEAKYKALFSSLAVDRSLGAKKVEV
ncbi:uncharacterized protein LOC121238106 [Juglans microcarpa x Juglans regia]|uniref:uncharacterized protein LOC121238106 n=1 Tax=Juglans microcarpa x Juglans regia TaxID=2249226 RepID=UPI001B7EA64C|nr:uncharacterized protein LOC121238106 [Juglans microcarpa x Juglans regia]